MPGTVAESPFVYWLPAGEPAPAHGRLLSAVDFQAAGDDAFAAPLKWLGGDFTGERWYLSDAVTHERIDDWHVAHHRRVAFATCFIEEDAAWQPDTVEALAEQIYTRLFSLQKRLALPEAQRIWHWLSDVTAGTGDDERYQRFCSGRASALERGSVPWSVLPPATLVSSGRRGLGMHVLLGDCPVTPIENPRQISAYRYPRRYGTRAPAFARAGVCHLAGSRYLLISGTASIVGHATRHDGNVLAQVEEALTNIGAVIAAAAPTIGERDVRELECVKAYLRHPDHMPEVRKRLHAALPGVPLALLHAPLCRDDLLVELEAQMPLRD